MVLLHGNPGFVQDWGSVVDPLDENYRVLAFDRPGHGYSERPSASAVTPTVQARLLHAALERLQVADPILVGHSWGGALALIYALEYPEDVSGLVLIGTRAFPLEGAGNPVYRLIRTPVLGDVFRYSLLLPVGRGMVAEGLAGAYAPEPPHEEHARAARDLWLRPSQAEATVWDTRNLKEELRSFSQRYRTIAVPTVILVGDHDAPERESIPLSRAIPGAKLAVLPGAGHQIPHTRPQAVVDAIDAVATAVSVRSRPTEGAAGDREPAILP